MIEAIYSYLVADSVLRALLGASQTCSRIFPEVAPQDTHPPYIVYRIQSEGGREEILEESIIQLSVYTATFAVGEAIATRLKALLDVEDQLNVSAANEYIYWSKHVDGHSIFEDGDGVRVHHRVLLFALKFKRKV